MSNTNTNETATATFSITFTICADWVVFAVAEALTNKSINLRSVSGVQEAVASFISDYGYEELKLMDADKYIDIDDSTARSRLLKAKEIVKEYAPDLFPSDAK